MIWASFFTRAAEKNLRKIPDKDLGYIQKALEQMIQNPFFGDVVKLEHQAGAYRRRVGNWRIFFDADSLERTITITAIERRTSNTY